MKIKNIFKNPLVLSISAWLSIIGLFFRFRKELLNIMDNITLLIILLLILGVLSTSTIYIIYTYYFQMRKIEDIKNDHRDNYRYVLSEISVQVATIYYNFATNICHDNPHHSLIYIGMALEQYIKLDHQQMINQVLSEIISILKKMEHGALESKDISNIKETISKIKKEAFTSEIQHINKLLIEKTP